MRKIPAEFENPIDNIILIAAEYVCPFFRATGHTPNIITLYSCLCGTFALKALHKRNFPDFLLFWGLSYFFDCLDGHFARKYRMVTVFGDYFDHVSDAVQAGIAAIIVTSYRPPLMYVILLLASLFLSMKHFGCQQRVYKASDHYDGVSATTLDAYEDLCQRPEDIRWTRMFGPGTLNVVFFVVVWVTLKAGEEKMFAF